jgi:hypothetical protein
MPETVNETRRRMLAATGGTLAAARIPETQAADARAGFTKGSFGPLKQVDTGVLNVGYTESHD